MSLKLTRYERQKILQNTAEELVKEKMKFQMLFLMNLEFQNKIHYMK